jgi:predicted DNA-binding ribbon-helix-helix protein
VKLEEKKEYWPSITQLEKERCTRSIALAGHRTSIHLTDEIMKEEKRGEGLTSSRL